MIFTKASTAAALRTVLLGKAFKAPKVSLKKMEFSFSNSMNVD